jgi:hypothetical protein
MGTLCKNCPFKDIKSMRKEIGESDAELNSCTDLFARKYHNSCVIYNIEEDNNN